MKKIAVKILDTTLEAALLSPKVAKRYENGIKGVVEKANEAQKLSSQADGIEMQCNAIIDFIDDIFGDGSAKKVFGEETDLLTCIEAFKQMSMLYAEQVNPHIRAISGLAKNEAS